MDRKQQDISPPRTTGIVRNRASIIVQFVKFLFQRGLWWLLPLFLLLLLFTLIILASQIPVIGPFIYSIF